MDFDKWFDVCFISIHRKTIKNTNDFIQRMSTRNLLRSSLTKYGIVDTIYKTIDKELQQTLQDLSLSLDLKSTDWIIIKDLCLRQIENISKQIYPSNQTFFDDEAEVAKLVEDSDVRKDLIDNLLMFVDLESQKAIDKQQQRVKKIIAEISRMFFSALIGALIGGYLTKYVFGK